MAETQTSAKSWISPAVLIGGIVALVLLPSGALGARLGLWPFTTGFLFLGGAALLSTVAVVGAIVGLILAGKANRAADRSGLYGGLVIALLILGFLFMQFNTARSVPAIHNISTDVADPPMFQEVAALRGEGTNPLAYDATTVVKFQDKEVPYGELQQQAYPDVRTHETARTPEQSLELAAQVLEAMGMEVVATNPAEGIVEATDTTFWFGFKDDVVVRLRESGSGTTVDVRSVSRVGLSDLGANAARIAEFLERFSAAG